MYQVDPNDNTKMIPKTKASDAYGHAITPAAETIQKRPAYVLINVSGTYAFSNNTSGSIGGTHADLNAYATGSVLANAASGPVRLEIQPVAWRQTDAAGTVGDVTFVYVGD